MTKEEQDELIFNYNSGATILGEDGSKINEIDTIKEEQVSDQNNQHIGLWYYNSDYFQYRILNDVDINKITIIK